MQGISEQGRWSAHRCIAEDADAADASTPLPQTLSHGWASLPLPLRSYAYDGRRMQRWHVSNNAYGEQVRAAAAAWPRGGGCVVLRFVRPTGQPGRVLPCCCALLPGGKATRACPSSCPLQWAAGDVIGCCIDLDVGSMRFLRNGKDLVSSGLLQNFKKKNLQGSTGGVHCAAPAPALAHKRLGAH